jgi:hypothetical protein
LALPGRGTEIPLPLDTDSLCIKTGFFYSGFFPLVFRNSCTSEAL